MFIFIAGNQGPFAVNLWFRANTSANTGSAFAYLLSTISNATQTGSGSNYSVYIPNSLQLMLPKVCSTVTVPYQQMRVKPFLEYLMTRYDMV